MRAFDKFKAAVFPKWDVAAGKLCFELRAVARRPKQHNLLLKRHACLPGAQNLLRNIAGLSGLVGYTGQTRLLLRLACGPKIFLNLSLAKRITSLAACKMGWVER